MQRTYQRKLAAAANAKKSNYRIRRKSTAATRPNTIQNDRRRKNKDNHYNRRKKSPKQKSPYGAFLVPLPKKQREVIETKIKGQSKKNNARRRKRN